MDDNEYKSQLFTQLKNAESPAVGEYLRWLYIQVAGELRPKDKVLEIGAGAGISKLFLSDFDVLRTDLLDHGLAEVQSGVNAENLPFGVGEFDAVFAMDMIHHVPFPYKVIAEAIRTTSPNGKVILVEPYVSITSYLIYKIFHSEKTSLCIKISPEKPIVSTLASDGNQVICQKLFFSRLGRRNLEKVLPDETDVTRRYISPISFFLTGGINKPIRLNPKIIKVALAIEDKIPQAILKLIASRQIVIIRKKSLYLI
ncbi:AdoMet_MTases domain containing protein [Candidatus Nanopelagicaceae bacterium]